MRILKDSLNNHRGAAVQDEATSRRACLEFVACNRSGRRLASEMPLRSLMITAICTSRLESQQDYLILYENGDLAGTFGRETRGSMIK